MGWERNIDLTYILQQKYSLHNSLENKTYIEFTMLVNVILHGSQKLQLRTKHSEHMNEPVKFIVTMI